MEFNKPFLYIFFILMSTVMIQEVNAAKVFKWVDEDGQVHYGSRANSKNAKEVEIKNRYIDSGQSTPPLSAQERADKTKKFINALDAENKSIADAKAKKRKEDESKVIRCNASRDQLRRYENSSALYDLDEKGNRILLNKKQYDQAMSQARARVQKWCN